MFTNKINNKKYVGKCRRDVKERHQEHIRGKGNQLLKQAFDKHGINNFTFEILHDGILEIFLNDYEKEAIKTHNSKAPNGYNLTDGGDGKYGHKVTGGTKQKISEARKGFNHTNETKQKISEARKGKIWCDQDKVIHFYTIEMKSLKEIANIFKTSGGAVKRVLHANNINIRPASFSNKGKPAPNKSDAWDHQEQIINLYTVEFLSTKKIGKRFNVSKAVISRILESNNIKLRASGFQSKS